MTKLHRVGIAGLVLLLLAGIWLFFSPLVFAYQPQGAPWVDATRNDLWTGGLLALTGLTGLIGITVATVRDPVRAANQRTDPTATTDTRPATG